MILERTENIKRGILMAKKDDEQGFVEEFMDTLTLILMKFPGWVGLVLAPAAFLIISIVLPMVANWLATVDPKLAPIATIVSMGGLILGPVLGFLILLATAAVYIRRRRNDELLDGHKSIRELTWREFEHLLGEAYRRKGYSVHVAGGDKPDGGVDIELRLGEQVTLVQCKHWNSGKVGVRVVRELLGVVTQSQAHEGILVASGGFTDDAIAFARKSPIIHLVGANELQSLIRSVQRDPGTSVPPAQSRTSPPLPSPSISTESVETVKPTPPCPGCGTPMVQRVAKRGKHNGNPFWGCPTYPKCWGKIPIRK